MNTSPATAAAPAPRPPSPELADSIGRHVPSVGPLLHYNEVKTVCFAPLRGMAVAELLDERFRLASPHAELIEQLRQVIMISKREWQKLGQEGHHYNRDSIAQLIDLHTRSSAVDVLLITHVQVEGLRGPTIETKITGNLLSLTNSNEFPDKDKLPWDYMRKVFYDSGRYKEGELIRFIRAHVTDEGREFAPRGQGLDMMMAEFEKNRHGRPVITKILVGPEEFAFTWSLNAFRMRGVEGTGIHMPVEDTLMDGRKVTLDYEFFVYPPQTAGGFKAMSQFTAKYDSLVASEQKRIAHASAHFSPREGSIAVLGPQAARDGAILAKLFPASRVYAVTEDEVPRELGNLRALSLAGLPRGLQGIFAADLENIDDLGAAIANLAVSGTVIVQGANATSEVSERFGLRNLYVRPLAGETVVAAEKIPTNAGVRIVVSRSPTPAHSTFLQVEVCQDKETGKFFELVRRGAPGSTTADALPYTIHDRRVFVYLKDGFPRPLLIMNHSAGHGAIAPSGYIPEQLSKIEQLSPTMSSAERERALAAAVNNIVTVRGALPAPKGAPKMVTEYFTSPGGVNELVGGFLVEIEANAATTAPEAYHLSTGGRVRAVELQQGIREAQLDSATSREERLMYELLLQLRLPLGPWLGEKIALKMQDAKPTISDVEALLSERAAAVFEPAPTRAPKFFEVKQATFDELDARGTKLSSATLQFASQKAETKFGDDTVLFAPVIMTPDGPLIGLEKRKLPSVQDVTGSPLLRCAPAFRILKSMTNPEEMKDFALARFAEQFGTAPMNCWRLGYEYFPTIGILPERVFPYLVEVNASALEDSTLEFVPLTDLVEARGQIRDGHTLTAMWRTAHALGTLRDPRRSFE